MPADANPALSRLPTPEEEGDAHGDASARMLSELIRLNTATILSRTRARGAGQPDVTSESADAAIEGLAAFFDRIVGALQYGEAPDSSECDRPSDGAILRMNRKPLARR